MSEPTPTPGVLDWFGVALLCGCAALAAILEVLFVPLYAGSVIVPVVIAFAVVGNVVLPRLAGTLVDSAAVVVAPFVVWLLLTLALGFVPRPEGDVLVPGGGAVEWVYLGAVVGGSLAGTVTLVVAATPRPRASTPAPVSR